MRDRPGGADQPDEPEESGEGGDQPSQSGADQPGGPDQPTEGDHADQPGERDPDAGTGQPRRWYEFELKEADEETQLLAQEKLLLREEGHDPELLDNLYGSDEELGLVETSESSDQPEEVATGWGDPAVSDNPDRPDVDELHLPDKWHRHIMKRHSSGAEYPDRSEFPPDWDGEKIAATILDVARNPDQAPTQKPTSGLWEAHGTRDGVTVLAAVRPSDNAIITGYPLSGPGVVRNPPKDTS